MPDNWENKLLKATEGTLLVPIVLFAVAVVTLLVNQQMNKPQKKEKSWANEVAGSRVKLEEKSSGSGRLKNIWDERKKNGSTKLDKLQKTDPDGKPFGSSYYYAHNSLRKTGGYKDGLRMEDYQMGAPRLLSKSGVQAVLSSDSKETEGQVDPTLPPNKRVSAAKEVSFIPVTKYLWDDPGDDKAIGTIRIDQLSDDLSWQEAEIEDVQLNLKDETCLSVILQVKNGKTYRLHIPKLYGKVEEVKKVSKANRLLLRLHKRKKDFSTGTHDVANIKAWPTPYKKAI